MGWDCYAYTFIGVRIPQQRLWEKQFLKHCECYDEKRYCEECSGEYIKFKCGASSGGDEVKFKYGYEIIDNEQSKQYIYICISKEFHDCKDDEEVVQGTMSLEELIQKRKLLKTILIRENLVQEDEFQDLFGIYTRANYDC